MTTQLGLHRGPLAAAVLGGSVLIAALYGHCPWWVCVAVGALAPMAATVPIRERPLSSWIQVWITYFSGHSTRAGARGAHWRVADVPTANGACGIREAGTVLVAMIQLAPNLDLPTVISDAGTYTEDTVPVAALAAMLDQYGIAVDIDIVTTGQRLRWTGSYGLLYDQLIGAHPVIGSRLTWLVLRLDQERNLAALARRGPSAVVAPKALAAAAHRIAGLLRQQGIAAHALPAAQLRDASRLLHAGVELTELRETWGHLLSAVPGRSVRTYCIDPAQLDAETLDKCWAHNSDHTTMTVSLTSRSPDSSVDGPTVQVRALVRYIGADIDAPPAAHLRLPTGRQSDALLASLPGPTTIRGLGIAPASSAAALDGVPIPIGPSGQILGVISGSARHTLALPLYDPTRYNPRRRTIDVQAQLPVAQQLVLRAAVVGANVEIHTSRPGSWRALVDEVGDPTTLRLAHDQLGATVMLPATIAVFDHLEPTATASRTTIRITERGGARQPADIAISQVSATAVNVSIPMHTVQVDLIEPIGETRYLSPAEVAGPPPAIIRPGPMAPAVHGVQYATDQDLER